MPQRERCRARSIHRKPLSEWAYYRESLPEPREPRFPPPVPPVYAQRIAEGIRHGLRLMLVYEDREGRRTKRHIVPKQWIVPGELVLAHCELRGVERHFRLDRFLDCQAVAADA
jgi:hypothetical protein